MNKKYISAEEVLSHDLVFLPSDKKTPKYQVGTTLVTIEGLKLKVTDVRTFPERILYTFDVLNQEEMQFPFATAAYFERELDMFKVMVIT